MPTSSRAARAFGVISSPSSAATPALVARYGSPPSSAKALKIDSAIGLRQTFAVQTKSTFFGLFVLAPPSVNCPLPPTRWLFPRPLGLTLSVRLLVGAHYTHRTPVRRDGSGECWL